MTRSIGKAPIPGRRATVALAVTFALALAGCGGAKVGSTGTAANSAAGGSATCGDRQPRGQPVGRLRGRRRRLRLRRPDQARLHRGEEGPQGAGLLAGLQHRRGGPDPGELGPPGPGEEVHHRPEGRRRPRPDRQQGDHRLVRAAVAGRRRTPTSPTGKNLNKYAAQFKTSESGGKGQLLDGDPSYVTNDEALVKNLNLDFKVVQGGSETALIQSFRQAEAQKKFFIAYFYEPQWFFDEMKLVRVNLPAYTDRLRRGPGQGGLRLPAVRPEQGRGDEVRRTRAARPRRSPRTSSGPTTTRTSWPSTSPWTRCPTTTPRRSGSTPTRTR